MEFIERSATVTPTGEPYRNLCIGCDRFHEEVLGPILAAAQAKRRAGKGSAAREAPAMPVSRRIVPVVPAAAK